MKCHYRAWPHNSYLQAYLMSETTLQVSDTVFTTTLQLFVEWIERQPIRQHCLKFITVFCFCRKFCVLAVPESIMFLIAISNYHGRLIVTSLYASTGSKIRFKNKSLQIQKDKCVIRNNLTIKAKGYLQWAKKGYAIPKHSFC